MPRPNESQLLIVCGAGRSGTSSVSGSLKMLGGHIPQPEVPANASNPRGHFEPQWVVDFHNKVLSKAGVHPVDARPEAQAIVAEAMERSDRNTTLELWLSEHLKPGFNVVKDPRTLWFHNSWTASAQKIGVPTVFLTMLRHPAEVVGSRDMHYSGRATDELRLDRETSSLAGWVNVMLTTERQTRGRPRTFLPYAELIQNWRQSLTITAERLDLQFDVDLATNAHHEVDDFIDPELRRSTLTMADLHAPKPLSEIAEQLWANLETLVVDPEDESASKSNDDLREQYDIMYRHASAMTMHQSKARAKAAASKAVKKARKKAAKEAANSGWLSKRLRTKLRG